MNENRTKKCLLTGELFIPISSIQKFSTPSNRVRYNNLKAKKEREEISYIQKPLIKNKRILDSLMKDKKEMILHKEFLRGCQFDFKVLSSLKKYNGEYKTAVFEYVVISDKENIKIVKQ